MTPTREELERQRIIDYQATFATEHGGRCALDVICRGAARGRAHSTNRYLRGIGVVQVEQADALLEPGGLFDTGHQP
jgi:hypothetical protein